MATGLKKLFPALLIGVLSMLGQLSASANHSFSVFGATVCTNGALISGTTSSSDSLNLLMVSQIIDPNSFGMIASGNTHPFTSVGETFVFTIAFPVGTLTVGQSVYVSVSDIPGTVNGNEGAFEGAEVADCTVAFFPNDDRINRRDEAAPIAVYARDAGLEIYAIDRNSNGELAFSVSATDIEAVGIPNSRTLIAVQGSINVFRNPDGQFVVTAPTYNGKIYVLFFDFVGSQSPYRSYEVE